MRFRIGDRPSAFTLPAIDGSEFNLSELSGRRYMLSFFRFATCPFCNLRVSRLADAYETFGAGFTIVGIFDSPLAHLQRYAARHAAPFPILADATGETYQSYGIERSWSGMLRGLFGRFPTLVSGLFRGYIPWIIRGHLLTMPADFLIDENSIVHAAYYGRDEGDHLLLSTVYEFSHGRSITR